MPMSMEGHISWVGKILREKRPANVLDVGIGMGFYGVLTRQLCDWIRSSENEYLKENWKTNLVGVEVFPKYIQDIQKWIYDKIIIGDITDIDISSLGTFDVVMVMDVLEHLNYEDGKRVITELKKISKFIIIATPCGLIKQDAICGNEHEIHLTGWVAPMHEGQREGAHELKELGNILEEAYFSPCEVILLEGDLK